jgi:hypothetical protein
MDAKGVLASDYRSELLVHQACETRGIEPLKRLQFATETDSLVSCTQLKSVESNKETKLPQ